MDSDKHIKFDLSKNQTYIIDNNETYSLPLRVAEGKLYNSGVTLLERSSSEADNTEDTATRYIATITVVTSFLFIINTSLAYSNKNYIYASLFLFLFLTSIFHRYIQNTYGLNKYVFLAHEIAIFFTIVYGAYMLYTKIKHISKIYLGVIITILIATAIMYWYGYNYECCCFDKDQYISENYMALVHIIASIGYNLIISM